MLFSSSKKRNRTFFKIWMINWKKKLLWKHIPIVQIMRNKIAYTLKGIIPDNWRIKSSSLFTNTCVFLTSASALTFWNLINTLSFEKACSWEIKILSCTWRRCENSPIKVWRSTQHYKIFIKKALSFSFKSKTSLLTKSKRFTVCIWFIIKLSKDNFKNPQS
jgi:hypothetical protein